MFSCIENERGQATVEAAVLLPVVFALLGLLAQPALLLYTSCVMNSAAAEGCRMLATNTMDEQSAKAFVLRRLAAVPNADAFHCGGKSGWDIQLEGGEGSAVSVTLVNRARPLPLLGLSCKLVLDSEDGLLVQKVSSSSVLMPQWALDAGVAPSSLAGEWK